MWRGRYARGPRPFGYRSRSMFIPALADLSVAVYDQPRISQLSMGHIAFGNRFPCGFCGASLVSLADSLSNPPTLNHHPIPLSLAFVSSDVRIGLCKAAQP